MRCIEGIVVIRLYHQAPFYYRTMTIGEKSAKCCVQNYQNKLKGDAYARRSILVSVYTLNACKYRINYYLCSILHRIWRF